ncbi:SET domain-containing protein [Byssothecium circinans]|uniref:SET domain-containing protein n=1 Tax=Byssothecium circinans TaxID=147558 RepID=A0A6A5U2R6_9PLEO|nr:SET domain-containing protein [Byssothecium circinans]
MSSEARHPGAKTAPFYIAQSKICVNAAGQCIGDGLFSGHDFKAGEFMGARKRPMIASLETERLRDTCANCYIWTEGSSLGSRLYVKEGTKVQACAGCKRFRYCSKACQKEAWTRGHKHECKNLRSVGDRELPKAVLGCMELLVRKKHGLISEQEWDILCRLDTHAEDFQRNGKYGGIELMALGTSEFSFTQDTFDKKFVAAMYARILSNSLTLITPTFDPLGIMVDPIFCHLNHSCDPNAYLVMDGPEIELHALKDIKMDEEIYISYVDPTNPFARRQSELKERWFFNCKCSKCKKGPKQQEDLFLVDPQDAPENCKEYADSLLKRAESPANDPTNYIGDSLDERRMAALQGELFNAYEEQQRTDDVKHAIKICQNAVELCSSSGLWPQHRQPLPALRDDLIVHLLADGQFELAWSHCMKRHQYVTPTLYPQTHHPIRVVQTWQMAMLAQYLASASKQLAPGIDMAVITAMLVDAVHTAAKSSHGEYSAFFKSVQGKFAEVESEVLAKFESKDALKAATKMQEKHLWEMGDWAKY